MTVTDLIEFEAGDMVMMVPSFMRKTPYISDEKLEELSITQILNSQTMQEAAREPGKGGKPQDITGEKVVVHSVGWRPGNIPGASLPVYVLIDLERETGAREVFTTGALRPIAVFEKAYEKNAYPLRGHFHELESQTPGRNPSLWFVVDNDDF